MDDNLSKALIMAGGVLLSILLVAFLNLSMNKMGYIASAEDEETLTKQSQLFNKEYEVYDKDLMYGVDVISCLCKAYDNNCKINNKYGEKLDASYEIKVKFTLKDVLEESIEVYHIDDNNKEVPYASEKGCDDVKLENTKFTFYNNGLTKFEKRNKLKTCSQDVDNLSADKEYELTNLSEEDNAVVKLINTVMSETVKNTDENTMDKWSKAVFKSVLYDMKTRKFKCTNFSYNSENGRVKEISFEEI